LNTETRAAVDERVRVRNQRRAVGVIEILLRRVRGRNGHHTVELPEASIRAGNSGGRRVHRTESILAKVGGIEPSAE
jgi:hypothetical protein